jgi:hypothetical protein
LGCSAIEEEKKKKKKIRKIRTLWANGTDWNVSEK